MVSRFIRQCDRHILTAIVFFALLNIAITMVIFAEQRNWKLTADPSKCLTDPNSGCYLVQHSVYAESFGIPNTIIGFIGFAAVIIVVLLLIFDAGPTVHLERALVGMLGIGALMALWFLYVQHFLLRTYCAFCVPIDLISLFMFGLALTRFTAKSL